MHAQVDTMASYIFNKLPVVLLLFASILAGVSAKSKCETCTDIVEKFYEGLKTTAKSNFGGGNTHWEEKSLGSFAFSETRLVDILDHLCDDNPCHSMLEEYEEAMEQWWFKHYAKKKDTVLHTYLCIERVSGACCGAGKWGPQCKPCPGLEDDLLCSGNGKCDGNGTREGTGKCECEDGYQGDLCTECEDDFYRTSDEDSAQVTCEACHISCEGGCTGVGPQACSACKEEGWSSDEEQGCIDINECEAEERVCKDSEFCSNNEGSYKCTGCHASCKGCHAAGAEQCVDCADRYIMEDGTCKVCHTSCSESCTDTTPRGCDACKPGWLWHEDHGCQDVNECEEAPCAEGEYCVNLQGNHKCKECDAACEGCTGVGNKNCRECAAGYSQDGDTCVDVDECSAEGVCGDNERCENVAGSHTCHCSDGYTRNKEGTCVQKDPKSKKEQTSSSKSSSKKASKKTSKDSTKSKSSKTKGFLGFLRTTLGMYTLQYIAALFGFAFVGNLLKHSHLAQLLFSVMFWLYILWFSMRFDGPTGKKGDKNKNKKKDSKSGPYKGPANCNTCKDIVKNIQKGIEETSKSNFGGGNTKWEEQKLGSYIYSETRFVEILDFACANKNENCAHMLERYEETLEKWWLKSFAQNKNLDLLTWLCIDRAEICCPEGTYGAECKACFGGAENTCSGHGKCEGEGTRKGTGSCKCEAGYGGDKCDECAAKHFNVATSPGEVDCKPCDAVCGESGCVGAGPEGCEDCVKGYEFDEEHDTGCHDMNECEAETPPCKEKQVCLNTPGSYKCIRCDRACKGCTETGPGNCIECADRFFRDTGGKCKACDRACESGCTGPGRNECVGSCRRGYELVDGEGCVDIDECARGTAHCRGNKYCANTDGHYQCKQCDRACAGVCTAAGPAACKQCKAGYERDEAGACSDIDECGTGAHDCTGEHRTCVNSQGSYVCGCEAGYTLDASKTCQKIRDESATQKADDQTDQSEPVPPSPDDDDVVTMLGQMSDMVEELKERKQEL